MTAWSWVCSTSRPSSTPLMMRVMEVAMIHFAQAVLCQQLWNMCAGSERNTTIQ